jgi:hypothetical protein
MESPIFYMINLIFVSDFDIHQPAPFCGETPMNFYGTHLHPLHFASGPTRAAPAQTLRSADQLPTAGDHSLFHVMFIGIHMDKIVNLGM